MRSQVRFLLGPPGTNGALAQLVEHLLCKQKVRSSILLCSTVWNPAGEAGFFLFCVSFFASSNSRLRKPQEGCYAARVLSLGFRSLELEFAEERVVCQQFLACSFLGGVPIQVVNSVGGLVGGVKASASPRRCCFLGTLRSRLGLLCNRLEVRVC